MFSSLRTLLIQMRQILYFIWRYRGVLTIVEYNRACLVGLIWWFWVLALFQWNKYRNGSLGLFVAKQKILGSNFECRLQATAVIEKYQHNRCHYNKKSLSPPSRKICSPELFNLKTLDSAPLIATQRMSPDWSTLKSQLSPIYLPLRAAKMVPSSFTLSKLETNWRHVGQMCQSEDFSEISISDHLDTQRDLFLLVYKSSLL